MNVVQEQEVGVESVSRGGDVGQVEGGPAEGQALKDRFERAQAAAILTLRAYLATGRRFPLYFFEVNSGSQTLGFAPTSYVDITATREKKKAALRAHRSQDGERIYRMHHEPMESFRGRELGVAAAEAFAQLARDSRAGRLPGL